MSERIVTVTGIGGHFGSLVALTGTDEDGDTTVVMMASDTALPMTEYPVVRVPESSCVDLAGAAS